MFKLLTNAQIRKPIVVMAPPRIIENRQLILLFKAPTRGAKMERYKENNMTFYSLFNEHNEHSYWRKPVSVLL
jgi:hypothetical protein